MDFEGAVHGAQLVAADIENSLGLDVQVGTEYPPKLRTFSEKLGRLVSEHWVSVVVPEAGITAGVDPSNTGSGTATEIAEELARLLQDDLQMHLHELWPIDPTDRRRALEPTAYGWRSVSDPTCLVPFGQLRSVKKRSGE